MACTVADLINEARSNPIRWIIPNILLEGGVHVLHGKEEAFKTMLTLQMHEALTQGGEFLMQSVTGGLRTGIVELEQKPRLFGHRLNQFFRNGAPNIEILPHELRSKVLGGRTAQERIEVIRAWADLAALAVVSIDSAMKLFPPHTDSSKPEQASEVFNQLQRLPTLWLIAHDRKRPPNPKQGGEPEGLTNSSNEEIVGSGRFAQDPDVIHQMMRPDGRSPMAVFQWGKVREDEKPPPLNLYFDKLDFRLRPLHPFLHLLRLGPCEEGQLIVQAERRYGWRERWARANIVSLLALRDASGSPAVTQTQQGHKRVLRLMGNPVAQEE